LEIEENSVKTVRLTMGGVAHKPWRMYEAEKILAGRTVSEATFRQAAEAAMTGAVANEHNAYKLKLAPNAMIEALKIAAQIS
jgi:xanthine dehydrogenase YagS FAD-binding subunit